MVVAPRVDHQMAPYFRMISLIVHLMQRKIFNTKYCFPCRELEIIPFLPFFCITLKTSKDKYVLFIIVFIILFNIYQLSNKSVQCMIHSSAIYLIKLPITVGRATRPAVSIKYKMFLVAQRL